MKNKDKFSLSISVVIPVYNASKFLSRAIKSALSQKETSEVILVEDGSTDDSYEICQRYAIKHDNVHLHIHKNHLNLGAGETRNLGVQKSNYNYISFLDADDYFLEKRFNKTNEVFKEYPEADGVYEAIGVSFDSEFSKKEWNLRKNKNPITSIKQHIKPEELFWKQSPIGRAGHAHLDGLTVKKSSLLKVGLFNPALRLHQDTDLFMKLAMACKMYPGEIESPIAIRGVHDNNRISKERSLEEAFNYRKAMWKSTYQWAFENGFKSEADVLRNRIRYCRLDIVINKRKIKFYKGMKFYILALKEFPKLIFELAFYKRILIFMWLQVKTFEK